MGAGERAEVLRMHVQVTQNVALVWFWLTWYRSVIYNWASSTSQYIKSLDPNIWLPLAMKDSVPLQERRHYRLRRPQEIRLAKKPRDIYFGLRDFPFITLKKL